MKTTKSEIIICTDCLGTGETYERISAYDSAYVRCRTCLGSEKLRVTTTTEVEPY